MEFVFELSQIHDIARKVLAANPEKIILFSGQMGAGKTTLIKALANELGVRDNIASPTFSLVNEYRTTSGEIIFHFDMYRIKSEAEAMDMGIEEYLYSGSRCFIEWAEKIPTLVPPKHSEIELAVVDENRRKLTLKT